MTLLTLAEARLVLRVLDQLNMEIGKRDKGYTSSHEGGRVRIGLPTEDARLLVAVMERAFNPHNQRDLDMLAADQLGGA